MFLVRAIAVFSTGLYAGIILGDRLGATYSRAALSPQGFVIFQQVQHVHFKPVMMPLTLLALLSCVLWVALAARRPRGLQFYLAALGALCFIGAFVITRIVNFPINDALMTWSAAAPPGNLRQLWAPWEQAHTVRAALSVGTFALQICSLSLAAWTKSGPAKG